MPLLQLYDEWFNAQPWDSLLALSIIGTVAIVPIAMAVITAIQQHRREQREAEQEEQAEMTTHAGDHE